LGIVELDEALQVRNLVQDFHFARHAARVLEDAIGEAKLFGHQRIVIQLARASAILRSARRSNMSVAR